MTGETGIADLAGAVFQPVLRHAALDLAPLPSAAPSARLHTRFVLAEWGFSAIARDSEVIVSEIVTNAVRASEGLLTEAGAPQPVRLRLTGRARGVQIEVWDDAGGMPEHGRPAAPDADGGRGLMLVEALSDRWGAYRTAGGGKVVFAVIGR